MTVETLNSFTDWIAANGSNKNWSYDFKILQSADAYIEYKNGANGAITRTQTNVAFVPDSDLVGGYLQYPSVGAALANTYFVRVVRVVAFTQDTLLGNEAAFYPETHELSADKLAMQIQQIDRDSLKVALDPIPTGELLASDGQGGAVSAGEGVTDLSEFVTEAGNSATAAANSASSAATSASTATTQAGIATTQAGLADTARIAAQLAKTQAETAKTNAETAETNAETAETNAETARDQAESVVAAFFYAFDNPTGDADPGPGTFRMNNGTIGSVTQFFVDNVDANGVNVASVLDDFGVGTSGVRSKLTLRKVGAPTVRHHFSVTAALTDGTGYRKIAVTYIGGSGAIADGDACVLNFVMNGDKGDAGLGGGDVDGPASSVSGNLPTFADTTGKVLADSGVAPGSLAPKASPTFTGTVIVPDNSWALAKLAQQAAYTLIGVAGSSIANVAAIAAGANDRVMSRVSNALGWNQITAGMLPNAIITYAMMTSSAIATAAEYLANTASKMMTAAQLWTAAAPVTLTDAATITVDMNTFIDSECALGGSRSLGAASNMKNGQKGVMWFTAVTSTRVLTLNGAYLLMSGVEVGPYSITTSQLLGLAYVVRGGNVYITGVLRR